MDSIERLEENVKAIEAELRRLAEGDRIVELLMTIPGCGEVCAWTIRARAYDIGRFGSAKKYAAFAGLAPWARDSNATVRHGRITKRGPLGIADGAGSGGDGDEAAEEADGGVAAYGAARSLERAEGFREIDNRDGAEGGGDHPAHAERRDGV
jgi:hypothetical protein